MSATRAHKVNAIDRDRPNANDAAWMKQLATGDLAPLGALYDRHHDDVKQFVRRAIGPDGAEDLTHDVFLTLARVAGSYDGRTSAKPFIFGIAGHLILRRQRALARLTRALLGFLSASNRAERRTPEDAASDAQELTRFEQALLRLSSDKRIVVLLIEREGLSGADVSRALGIPVATVWTRLHGARRELRDAVARGRKP